MASVSSLGVGSGIDIKGLLKSLMEAEGAAKTARFDRKEAEYEAKLSLYGTVKSALSDFKTSFSSLRFTSTFNVYQATSSDESAFTATATNGAELTSYDLEVNQIAQSQKLISAGFADKNSTSIGTGTLVINFGTYAYDVAGAVTGFTPDATATTQEIEITDGTLEGIRDSINDADIGATASIINDPATGYKLVLSSESGEQNAVNITVKAGTDSDGNDENNSGLSQLAYDPTQQYAGVALTNLTESQKALSANLTVDGVPITSESNTISDVIDNVTLELEGTTSSTETLSIGRDTTSIMEAVQAFVDGYNSLMTTINSASSYDEETEQAGLLIGDASIRGIVNQIRSVLNNTVSDPTLEYNSLGSIGILTKFRGGGLLEFDASKLEEALNEKPEEVKYLLAGGKTSTTSSDFDILSVTDNIGAGSYSVNVESTRGYYTGTGYFDSSTALNFSGGVNAKFTVNGVTSNTINLSTDYYQGGARTAAQALAAFKSDLQGRINADANLVSANASVVVDFEQDPSNSNNYLIKILSDKFDSSSSVSVDLDVPQISMTTGGVSTAGSGDGVFLIGGEQATYEDGIITGLGLYAGFQLRVGDSFIGDLLSSVKVSQGSLSALNNLVNSFLESDGLLDSKTDGLNASVADLAKQRVDLTKHLTQVEERYIKQFSAMDALVSQLNSTSSFLENQLSSLPNSR